jgi:predicted Fe-Mo cluster-binding NifX family protein
MKIAVSSSGESLASQIDPRYGRCAYFLIVETDDMSFEVFQNESMTLGSGAGIQSAQFVASKGAQAVITGNCGPNATRALSAAGIELFVGQSGSVGEAVERYNKGVLKPTSEANVSDHYGMDQSMPVTDRQTPSFGRGMGMGRGMGRGRGMRCGGRGMGRGTGLGRGMAMPWQAGGDQTRADTPSKDEELKMLKADAVELKRQMEKIESQIKKLEKAD